MKNRGNLYTVQQLLQNDSFLRWKLFEAEEDRIFWENYLSEQPGMHGIVEEAGRIARSIIRLNDFRLTEQESLAISLSIQNRLQKDKRVKRLRLIVSTTAAACLLLFFFLQMPFEKEGQPVIPVIAESHSESVPEECTDIQIIIGDSERVRLDQDADIKYDEAGNIIVRNEQNEITKIETKDKPIEKNKLIVPKGKRSSLLLADGTKVWINSGSTLEFPHSFIGNKREIRVDGEIYIEVAKDKERPFIVKTSDMAVEVLGTRFNVSSYEEDGFSSVVLVEGAVKVASGDNKIVLEPDQLASVSMEGVAVKKVNVYDYISWKDGLLQFNSEPLSLILTRLSRYYDIRISGDEKIANIKCTGKLVLFDDISKVLKTITKTVPVQYEIINDNEIIISKK